MKPQPSASAEVRAELRIKLGSVLYEIERLDRAGRRVQLHHRIVKASASALTKLA